MVAQYQLIPRALLPAFTTLVATAEVAAGALLLASLWLPVHNLASVLAGGLLLLFSIAVATALARGLEIPCGCGLLLNGHVITRFTLLRNLVLLSLLGWDALVR